jgi:hypothetical protein
MVSHFPGVSDRHLWQNRLGFDPQTEFENVRMNGVGVMF